MMIKYVITTVMMLALASPAFAQCFFGCGGGPIPVTDLLPDDDMGVTATATSDLDTNLVPEIVSIEQQNILPGLAGGFDYSQTLSGDLEQQVSSAGGMPLTTEALGSYVDYWPGYTSASYVQDPPPGSPEANMATTLGTLQGALEAGADQQTSQQIEAQRMTELEANIGAAAGNLQALEAIGEIDLFNGQEEIKQRNATNGQLNALLVVESNKQNKEAQDQLESMAIAGEQTDWDLTNGDMQEQDPQIPDAGLSE